MLVSQPGAEYLRLGQGKEDVGMGQTTGRNDGPLTQASAEWHEPSPMSPEAMEPGTPNPRPRASAGNLVCHQEPLCLWKCSFPTPAVSSPSASFCSLSKNCDMRALKCHWPQFQLLRWKRVSKWASVAGYLLLALSRVKFVMQVETEKVAF